MYIFKKVVIRLANLAAMIATLMSGTLLTFYIDEVIYNNSSYYMGMPGWMYPIVCMLVSMMIWARITNGKVNLFED